jgi:chromosome condensin MukBEF ATPase and DNA-binding subunit MukB
MSKDPAILFYTSDFLTGTFTMTDDQVGKYIRLLCLQHQKGSLTEKDMLKICKTYDNDIFDKFIKEGENYYNDRMKFEAEKRKKYSESRAENRKQRPEKPLKSSKKKPKNISLSYDKHMENENEIENDNKNLISFYDLKNL